MRIWLSKSQIVVNSRVDNVFTYLADLTNMRDWAIGNIESMERSSEGPIGLGSTFTVKFRTSDPGLLASKMVITEYVRNERVAFERQRRSGTYIEVQPDTLGTRITLRDWLDVPRLLAFVIPVIYIVLLLGWPWLRWQQGRILRRLKARLEFYY